MIPSALKKPLTTLFGVTGAGRLARYRRMLPAIARFESEIGGLPDVELTSRARALQYRARSGEDLMRLVPETYALVREAARRTIGLQHFDVQLLGGLALIDRSIAEMQTGEGKTLAATLPLALYAFVGKGAHLATVNDYLARRDSEWMGPVYRLLGLTVGVIQSEMDDAARRAAYACDVTYGTAKEFGFDFLRDRLIDRSRESSSSDASLGLFGLRAEASVGIPVQREPYFALIDEADSILIDEARTPLIIGSSLEQPTTSGDDYRWSAVVVERFSEPEHFEVDRRQRVVRLTPSGRELVRLLDKPPELQSSRLLELYEHVERAILVRQRFHRDRDYVIRDGEAVIVDEFTGRMAEGRRWKSGLHQAVEAKEGLDISFDAPQAARITVQDLFQRYTHLAGMTATAQSAARELRRVYRLSVVSIPTHRPVERQQLPVRIFSNEQDEWSAVVDEIREMHRLGRPVLVGTRSIDKSERLSQLLHEAGIKHHVLNARFVATEADIVAGAGGRGRVTVATNMAGRGTDIRLGEGVAALGGLHVIGTEMHDSVRVDRQLAGRCGRQGDPGTFRQYLALDNEILESGLGTAQAASIRAAAKENDGALRRCAVFFETAQRSIERRHFRQRQWLLDQERSRKDSNLEMGLDPYLDVPD